MPSLINNCVSSSSEIEKSENKSDGHLKELKVKLSYFRTLKENYKKQQSELAEKGLEQRSLSDKDFRRMKNNGRLDICYNVRSTVDSNVIDVETVSDINDENQLSNMALRTKSILKRKMMVIVDTSYYNFFRNKFLMKRSLSNHFSPTN